MTSEDKNDIQETPSIDVEESVSEPLEHGKTDGLAESELASFSQIMEHPIVDWLENSTKSISNRIQQNPRNSGLIAGAVLLILASFLVDVPTPHVSLAGERLIIDGPSFFTNSFLTTLIVDVVILGIVYLSTKEMSLVPGGLQNLVEALIEYLYDLAESVAGKDAPTYFPWAATIFIFFLISNWSGLIPLVGSLHLKHPVAAGEEHGIMIEQDNQLAMADGVILIATPPSEEGNVKNVPIFRAPSADLSTTFALALATMFMVQFYGIRALGGSYFRKFWNTSGKGAQKAINIFVGVLEAISELSRILTFAFRIFGNIFAGEVVLATMAFLFAFLVPLPFYALEVLVGVIQAFVFTILSLIFFSMATQSHDHEGEAH